MSRKKSKEARLSAQPSAEPKALLSLELGKEPPAELRLFKMGANQSEQGEFQFSQRSAEIVLERAKEWGNQFHFDWDHHAFLTLQGVKSPAAAWYDLELRDDGLWAKNIQWTPEGKKDVQDKSYRYLSPYFDYDGTTREITRFNNAALTNLPAGKQLEALLSRVAGEQQPPTPPQKEEPTMERKALLSMLGMPENTSDADLNAKMAQLGHFRTTMLAQMGVKSDVEAVSALLSMRSGAAEAERLAKELEKQKEEAITKERTALLSQAVEAGQLEPGGELKKQLESQSVEFVKAMLSQLPKKAVTQKTPPASPDGKGAGTPGEVSALLSLEQVAAAKKSATWFEGNKAEDIEKHWATLAQGAQR